MLIKLNERGVRAYMASGGVRYRRPAIWQGRTGRIVSYSRDRSHANVIWNGRRSPDAVSVDLIDFCSLGPDVADALVSYRRVDKGNRL
jgi:hypothetical protein